MMAPFTFYVGVAYPSVRLRAPMLDRPRVYVGTLLDEVPPMLQSTKISSVILAPTWSLGDMARPGATFHLASQPIVAGGPVWSYPWSSSSYRCFQIF